MLAASLAWVLPTDAAMAGGRHRSGATASAKRRAVYGVTVDDIGNLGQVLTGLHRLPQRPTARVYFDVNEPARYYLQAVAAMHRVSYVMGELLDSSDEPRISAMAYARRVSSYISSLRAQVDVWEIGNEVNGNWTGPYPTVSAKLIEAYRAVSTAHRRSALTLYDNVGCGDGSGELDPLSFSRRFVPAEVRRGLDLVLLSYYEDQCGGARPSPASWSRYFRALHTLYPRAHLGFGELGLRDPVTTQTQAYAIGLMRYYYGLRIGLPYYVGGYFWWHWAEDCLSNTSPLGAALRSAFAAERIAMSAGTRG